MIWWLIAAFFLASLIGFLLTLHFSCEEVGPDHPEFMKRERLP